MRGKIRMNAKDARRLLEIIGMLKNDSTWTPPARSAGKLIPGILLHPNIPKPLHGLNPRSILGDAWWDEQRHAAYAENGQRCWACGVGRNEAKFHHWLEGHEVYEINYSRGSTTMVYVSALCHACHNFIHNGRMLNMLWDGELEWEKFHSVLYHGFRTLKLSGLPPNPFALRAAKQGIWFADSRSLTIPGWMKKVNEQNDSLSAFSSTIKWEDWRLILNGVEYKPIFKDQFDWSAHYGKKGKSFTVQEHGSFGLDLDDLADGLFGDQDNPWFF